MTLNDNDFYTTPIPKNAWLMPNFSIQYQKAVNQSGNENKEHSQLN